MTDQSQPAGAGWRSLAKPFVTAWMGLAVAWLGGCGSAEKPDGKKPSAGDVERSSIRIPDPPDRTPTPIVQPGTNTAEPLLRRMASAYKRARSYADRGRLHLVAQRTPEPIDQTFDFSVAFVRPNKLRMEVDRVRVVCDGEKFYASIPELPGQVVVRRAPDELTGQWIYADQCLGRALVAGTFGWSPVQLAFLLENDPVGRLLENARRTVLDEPAEISGRDCFRVRIQRREGDFVVWIDQQSFLLRRINYPTDYLRESLAGGGTVGSVSLVAEFAGAQLDTAVDPVAFKFEIPRGTERFEWFRPPQPGDLLAKKVPEYKFFQPGNKAVTSASLSGKIVVLNFWAAGWKPSHDNLARFEKVYQQYKQDSRIAWLAVNVNGPDTDDRTLRDTFADLGVHVPLLRDDEDQAALAFNVPGRAPVVVIVDAAGVMQDCEIIDNPNLATDLPGKLEKLLAGEDIYREPLARFQKQWRQHEKMMEAQAKGLTPEAGAGDQQAVPIPRAEIAEQTRPRTFQLTRLWQCTELTAPGNVLVVPSGDGPPRLLVVDTWKSVAEIGVDGRLVARHPLNIEQMEFVNTLRTATAADGQRYFVALFTSQQRCHLLDEGLQLLLSYPESALEQPHAGLADAHLADLDGDGTLELYTAYWGILGVRAASLDGKSLRSNRTAAINVQQIAVTGPDDQGRRRLICANTRDSLALLDANLRPQGSVTLPGRALRKIAAADLDGDGRPEWCGIYGAKSGENVAVGFDLTGKELFSYTLPEGIHELPVERIIPGNLTGGRSGQWLLPGPDGSIHVLAADGKPLDRFNYGHSLAGLATAAIAGKPVLIVASSKGVEALQCGVGP